MSNAALKLHARLIRQSWQNGIGTIVETGRMLIKAKAELGHGKWHMLFEGELMPFSKRTAAKLMSIARNPIISNRSNWTRLPNSWGTLYDLSRLPDQTLIDGLKRGAINPQTERKEV